MSSQGVMSSKEASNNPVLCPVNGQQSGLIRVRLQTFPFIFLNAALSHRSAGIPVTAAVPKETIKRKFCVTLYSLVNYYSCDSTFFGDKHN
jgi:hypothetical protein